MNKNTPRLPKGTPGGLFIALAVLAKTAYTCGLNAVTVSFGRFLFGAAVVGLDILSSPHKSFQILLFYACFASS